MGHGAVRVEGPAHVIQLGHRKSLHQRPSRHLPCDAPRDDVYHPQHNQPEPLHTLLPRTTSGIIRAAPRVFAPTRALLARSPRVHWKDVVREGQRPSRTSRVIANRWSTPRGSMRLMRWASNGLLVRRASSAASTPHTAWGREDLTGLRLRLRSAGRRRWRVLQRRPDGSRGGGG